ncbi:MULTISPECIES: BTAD domain-containing putative transcriptional regulator [Pontibacillus]|uniref:BTAD domain-containing putative transcriptional regulator n=1 Tax=Pontibacillus chungwhensis TaxID=265426 RepID=A0ABY8V158_9BACI|nr:BTAD domain-containing putative transcriptional regulator [Pontibacillus chungwhensis]MCD5325818.1 transcriptional regulator [Pontibacillus sp. HN14]WIF98350.1 BTAD domain-containing putative transcriptional regulator [Pontibacillus chungwhensis]
MSTIPIIQTQLRPPVAEDRFVRRSSLQKKMASITRYPLICMHGGAGYGKSTALTLFVQDSGLDIAWYSVSSNDDDLIPFLTKWIYALRFLEPSFGEHMLSELDRYHQIHQKHEMARLVSLMINELNQIDHPVYFVMDDFHHLQPSTAIKEWMELFLEHLPSHVHMILASRSKIQFNVLTSLKVKGNLLELNQEDLLLSQEEMGHVLEDVYGLQVEENDLKAIHRTTEGWAIAFEMILQQLQAGVPTREILQNHSSSLQDLFDYLAQEVVAKQSLFVQQFLEQTAILDVFSADVCDNVLGMSGSKQMLEQLASQQLFLQRIDETHYRYHALIKIFLENRMKQKDQNSYITLHSVAATYYEKNGDMETALYHAHRVAEGRVASILERYGETMIQSGKLQSLHDSIRLLSEDVKENHPMLWFYEGEVLRYRSSYEQSEACYNAIYRIGKTSNDAYITSLALEGMARIYLDTIQPEKGERYLQQAIEYREKAEVAKEEMAHLYHLLAENLLNAGQARKAESWYKRAKELHLPLQDDNFEARLYLRTGRLNQAEKVLKSRKKKQPQNNHLLLPQSHRETDILLSIIAAFMGKGEESKKHAEEGIQQGIQVQSPFVEACGWMRIGHAVQLSNHYESDLAERCYQTSLEMMETLNVSRGKAEPYMGLCVLYGVQGQYEKAMETGERGLYETEHVQDVWLSTLIQLCMAIASVYSNKYEQAAEKLNGIEKQFHQCGDQYGLMLTSYWKAFIDWKTGDEESFEKEMRSFLQRVQTGQYEFFLTNRTTFGPVDLQNTVPLLFKARSLHIHESFVTMFIKKLGYGKRDTHPGFTLRIETFGPLKLYMGTRVIVEEDWQRGKAKELFELLITKRKHLVRKEEILSALWPDQDEESANRGFKVALNALLKTIEPDRKARGASFFIKKEGSAYGIHPESGYELDSALFEEWVEAGLLEHNPDQVKSMLERGLSLYKDDYLPDQRLSDWCLHERERLQVLFLRGAERLAQFCVRLEEYDTCIHWCERILRIDATWEEAYRLMMFSYYQRNNRPQAIKWYQKCCKILDDELGVPPMESTQEMFQLIRKERTVQTYATKP